MSAIVVTYLLYLVLSVGLTVWVGQTLHINGRVFLVDVFRGNTELADSINHLLLVGFYLINMGWICLMLKTGDEVLNLRGIIEALASKMGLVLLVLGGMHLFNVAMFGKMRNARQQDRGDNGSYPPAPLRAAPTQPWSPNPSDNTGSDILTAEPLPPYLNANAKR